VHALQPNPRAIDDVVTHLFAEWLREMIEGARPRDDRTDTRASRHRAGVSVKNVLHVSTARHLHKQSPVLFPVLGSGTFETGPDEVL
jgi:hypothetical protein